jgi:hypothetical protein
VALHLSEHVLQHVKNFYDPDFENSLNHTDLYSALCRTERIRSPI